MEKTNAIILKSLPYTDTRTIVRCFSQEEGYMSFITNDSHYKKKKNFLPMGIAEIEFFRNKRGELHSLIRISHTHPLFSVYADIGRMNILLLWVEILEGLLSREEADETLYEYIKTSVIHMEENPHTASNFNLFFLYNLLRLIGIGIDTSTYKPGYEFCITDGSFQPPGKNARNVSGPNSAKIIHSLCTGRLDYTEKLRLNGKARSVLLDILLLYIDRHFNTKLYASKGIDILRQVFTD